MYGVGSAPRRSLKRKRVDYRLLNCARVSKSLDGQSVAQAVETDGSTTTTTTYLNGPGGALYSRTNDAEPLWHVYDGHGNVLGTVRRL